MDKELMDCLLSDEDLIKIRDTHLQYNCPLCGLQQLIQAQLQSPKLKAYTEEQVQAEREKAKEIISSLLPISCGTCVYCNRGEPKNKDNIHLILNGEDVMCLEHEFYEEAREYLEGGD